MTKHKDLNENRVGYKKTKLGWIPEEWEVVKLGDIGEFKNGVNKSKDDFGSGHPFINLMDVFGKPSIVNQEFSLVEVTTDEINNYNLLKGDVLFIRSSVKREGVGLTSLIKEDLPKTVYSGFIIRFRENKSLIFNDYKEYCFYESKFRNSLIVRSSSSANTNINQFNLSKLKLPLPPLPEQQKIAQILSTWDKAIEQKQALIQQLKIRKKGLMQQLLSGKKRLEGFSGEWEKVKLGDLIKERREYPKNELPLYSLTIENGVVPKSKRYERSFLLKTKVDAYKQMCPNDFALNPMNLRFGAIAKYKGTENICVSKYYNIFHCNDKCDASFIEYYLTSYDMIQYYNKMAIGTLEEKKRVHYSDFINFRKTLPSKKEQTAIAQVLNQADQEIKTHETHLLQLQEQKKGLMQQLLTGQIRVEPTL